MRCEDDHELSMRGCEKKPL